MGPPTSAKVAVPSSLARAAVVTIAATAVPSTAVALSARATSAPVSGGQQPAKEILQHTGFKKIASKPKPSKPSASSNLVSH